MILSGGTSIHLDPTAQNLPQSTDNYVLSKEAAQVSWPEEDMVGVVGPPSYSATQLSHSPIVQEPQSQGLQSLLQDCWYIFPITV